MIRRSLLVMLAGAVALALAPAASAQTPVCGPDVSPPCTFEHDSSRDGTPNEIRSGFYGGDDGNNADGDPLADRVPNSYETFEFRVYDDSHGTFNVHVEWADPQIDLDVYVYRIRPDGTLVSNNVANSASFGDNDEDAEHRPAIGPVQPDRYLVVVDNWCSSPTDPGSSPASCGFATEKPNEDDFSGVITFGEALRQNPHPTVTLNGPDSGRVGQPLTFTADARDDRQIVNYSFDFDGDGFFETNALESNTATHRFSAGTWNVGVRVTDDEGDKGFARKAVNVGDASGTGNGTGTGTGAVTPADVGPLTSFKLSGPVFGGRKGRKLVIRYRLRERSRVVLTLHRGKTRVRRLVSGTKRADRTFVVRVRPRGLRRALYKVRISVVGESGRTERARLASRRL